MSEPMERGHAAPGCIDREQGRALEGYVERHLSPELEAAFEDHYFRCAACLDEVRLRQALPAALGRAASGGRAPAAWWAAAAAGLAAVVLAWPAWLGISRLPEERARALQAASDIAGLREQVDELGEKAALAGWSGPVSITVLTGPDRGPRGDGPVRHQLRLRPGQPFVPLGVVPALPDDAGPDAVVVIQILAAGGHVVWQTRLPVDQARSDVAGSGVVALLVPSSLLAPGEYEMSLLDGREAGPAEPLMRARFTVLAD